MLLELQPNGFHACYIGPWNTGALITRCVRDPGEMSGYGRYHLSKAAPSQANSPAREMTQLPLRVGPFLACWSDKRRPLKKQLTAFDARWVFRLLADMRAIAGLNGLGRSHQAFAVSV
jgi:hypothetical protein